MPTNSRSRFRVDASVSRPSRNTPGLDEFHKRVACVAALLLPVAKRKQS